MYKDQTDGRSSGFNHEMDTYLRASFPQVAFLNVWNLTHESLNRTSDGFHQVSDVNLIKVMTILNTMKALHDRDHAVKT